MSNDPTTSVGHTNPPPETDPPGPPAPESEMSHQGLDPDSIEVQQHFVRTMADFDKRFVYHKPNDMKTRQGKTQIERYQLLRDQAHTLATSILNLTPESREQSLAFTQLEQAVMWANSAIARRE